MSAQPAFQLTCPQCGQLMDVGEELRGSQILCPSCHSALFAAATLPEMARIKCPRCSGYTISHPEKKMSTAGVLVLIAGICFVPFAGAGIILIIAALFMKEIKYRCLDCGKWF